MTDSIKTFYSDIINKKRFWVPLLFFALVGYSFSIYNKTVGVDDLMWDYYKNYMLSGRWGMIVWIRLTGLFYSSPFTDRFLALVLYVIASILLCYLFFSVDKFKNILAFTITASAFVTYPLINEIWEYTGADYMVAGNLCLVTHAAIVIKSDLSVRKKLAYASALLIIPMSSYESAIFYYITLVCVVIFYEQWICKDYTLTIKTWAKQIISYLIPLLIAFIIRFAVSFCINSIFNLEYHGGGATGTTWIRESFVYVLKNMIGFIIFDYGIMGLVYLPITIFLLSLILFTVCILFKKGNRMTCVLLGGAILVSLFVQSIIQGYDQPYRTSQVFTLFVAFSFYLTIISISSTIWRRCLYVALFGICWHQAVYMNRLLGLNNLRSDNELAVIRQIGYRLVSEFEKKPVVFVSPYKVSDWISRQVSVDESTWNGRLFYRVYDNFMMQFDQPFMNYQRSCTQLKRPFKYVGTNVNSMTIQWHNLHQLFSYCGYDIEGIPDNLLSDPLKYEEYQIEQKEATIIAREMKISPYQIYDHGDYLIVNLGGDLY